MLKHYTSPDFWEQFYKLPKSVQDIAKKNYELLKANPRHPSLHFKKVKPPLWSARAGDGYRALAIPRSGHEFEWIWIGSHADYDKLLR